MKLYTAKTLEDCLEQARNEIGVNKEDLMYKIVEEKKGLFSKKITISVEETSDVILFIEEYIKDICHAINLDASLKTFYRENLIKVLIETNHNSILIGNNGKSLESLNELVKLAVSQRFKKKFRILLDIGNYKDKKYSRVIHEAKKVAKEVLSTHVDTKLEPMTPDERKKVHNALTNWKNIKTESVGDGKNRAVVIKYVPGEVKNKPENKATTAEEE